MVLLVAWTLGFFACWIAEFHYSVTYTFLVKNFGPLPTPSSKWNNGRYFPRIGFLAPPLPP